MKQAEKHMDLLTEESLKSLLAEQEGPCVSLYMPTHRKGPEIQQDPLRLKNLLRDAEKQLVDSGIRAADARDFLEPARERVRDNGFWRLQSDGLACFLSRNLMMYRLPQEFEELTVVGQRFHVKPLLPALTGDGRFFVLALSQGDVRFLQATHYTVGEIDLGDVPKNMKEVLQMYDFETSLQFHTQTGSPAPASAGERGAMFHGHGAGSEKRMRDKVIEFLRQIDKRVCDLLANERAPLVLAGVEFIRAFYREANHYDNLLEEGIDGNPDPLSTEELHQEAWKIVKPLFEQQRAEALDRYQQLKATKNGKSDHELRKVVPAAYYKRVDTLFVPLKTEYWGYFNPEENKVKVHKKAQPGDEDLLNFAVVHTLRNGGTVYTMKPEDMPGEAEIAAIYW